MAMEYLTNLNYEKLAPVLEDCASWFTQIAISVAYPERDTQLDKIQSPTSFKQWLFDANEEDGADKNVINEIHRIYTDMINAGENIVEQLRSQTKPDYESFELFKGLYNGFVSRLRLLETGSVMSGSGVCPKTGFRSREAIMPDQKKEMERLRRQGTAFCLVLVRVDGYENHPDGAAALKVASECIKSCMRAFDDGYYLGSGYVLLSLKQTDIIGAEAATERLQIILRDANKDDVADLSLSCCMAEPVEDDEIDEMLKLMRKDLDEHINEKSVSLKFIELSPLQRYLDSVEG